MKISKIKKFVGVRISWEDRFCTKKSGVLKEINGKSALIDIDGIIYWTWIPDMDKIKPG